MAIYFWALVLFGGMAVGNPSVGAAGAKPAAENLPAPESSADLRLEKAAREFRINTYEAFHENRGEYDRRQGEAVQLQQAWADAGSDPDQQPKLIDWFEQASAATQNGAAGDLPPAPTFIAVEKPQPQEQDAGKKLAGGDKRLNVKPAGSAAVKADATDESTDDDSDKPAAEKPDAATAKPETPVDAVSANSTVISSLPRAFEAEVVRVFCGFGKKSPSRAPAQAPRTK